MKSSDRDFSMFYSNFESNPEFETCMNNAFSDKNNPTKDLEQIREINELGHWRELSDDNIMFIKRKMNMFLINSNQRDIVNCMRNNLYMDVSICDSGVSEQIVKVMQIMLFIIGYDFRNDRIETDEDRVKLEKIIKELGPIFPRVLKSIVDISEMYEKQECPNGINQNTHLLRKIHDNLFSTGKNMVNFELGLSDLTDQTKTNDNEFNRSIMLMAMGIAFLRFF